MDFLNITQFCVILANFHKLLLFLCVFFFFTAISLFRCIVHKNDIKKTLKGGDSENGSDWGWDGSIYRSLGAAVSLFRCFLLRFLAMGANARTTATSKLRDSFDRMSQGIFHLCLKAVRDRPHRAASVNIHFSKLANSRTKSVWVSLQKHHRISENDVLS